MKRFISETIIGSHIWDMNHSGSDIDVFRIFVANTKEFLMQTANLKSNEIKIMPFDPKEEHGLTGYELEDKVDVVNHEAGKVVEQLLKGNLNFIIGVLSPIVKQSLNFFHMLRKITLNNLAKNCFHSIYGMAKHNYKKYVENGKDDSEHRCNKIMRTIQFGIKILKYKKIVFQPQWKTRPEEIPDWMEVLEGAYEDSKLPEKPDPDHFRHWLYIVRMCNLDR